MTRPLYFTLILSWLLLPLQAEEKPLDNEEEVLSNFTFAFVCVEEDQEPDHAKTEAAFRKAFALKKEDVFDVEIEEKQEEGRKPTYSISATFGDGDFILASGAGSPVPWKDIEYACGNSVFWPEAEEVLKKSQSHYIVFIQSAKKDPKERALCLSRALLAVANATDALGIYYGTADIVHEPKAYAKAIADPINSAEDVPAIAWVGFLFQGHEGDKTSLYTRGLAAFGCKEVEVVESKKKPSELFELAFGLSQYLIFAGDVIEDGDTVGGTEEEKIKVYLKKSQLDRPKVLQVEF